MLLSNSIDSDIRRSEPPEAQGTWPHRLPRHQASIYRDQCHCDQTRSRWIARCRTRAFPDDCPDQEESPSFGQQLVYRPTFGVFHASGAASSAQNQGYASRRTGPRDVRRPGRPPRRDHASWEPPQLWLGISVAALSMPGNAEDSWEGS